MLELAQDRFRELNLLSRASFKQGGSETFPFKQQQFDFILLDIGLSSLHINHFDQGISFLSNEPLDMRMDMSIVETAADLLVQRSERELADIFYLYGEERRSFQLARNIKKAIADGLLIETTFDLKELIRDTLKPKKVGSYAQKFPEVRIFQALRIAVNNELNRLNQFLTSFHPVLRAGGILVIISFHSLEDRMVKNAFKELAYIEDHSPDRKSNRLPGAYRILTKKPVVPGDQEIRENSRARSAKLRALQKVNQLDKCH